MKRLLVAVAIGLVIRAGTALATSVYYPNEDAFADTSAVIAKAQVGAIQSHALPNGTITTEIELKVVDPIRGATEGEELRIYQPGGEVSGRRQWVTGSPEYEKGETVLVFLGKLPDGALTTHGLALGRVTLQDGKTSKAAAFFGDTDYTSLQDKLRKKYGGEVQQQGLAPMYAVRSFAGESQVLENFKLMNPVAKWRRASIPVFAPNVPDKKIGSPGSTQAVQDAVAAWRGAGSTLGINYAGEKTPTAMSCVQGQIGITYDDPTNQIELPSNCSGVLAVGGFCSDGSKQPDGYQTINAGALTFADGWGGCSFWNLCNVSEVVTHELGHTFGIGHSCDSGEACPDAVKRAATMFWMAHFDGRCAKLMEDDTGAALFVYSAGGGTPGPTGTPGPSGTPKPTATPRPSGSPEPTQEGWVEGQANFYTFRSSTSWASTWYVPRSLDLRQGLQIVISTRTDQRSMSAKSPSARTLYARTPAGTLEVLSYSSAPRTRIRFSSTTIPAAFAPGEVQVAVTSGVHGFVGWFDCTLAGQTASRKRFVCR